MTEVLLDVVNLGVAFGPAQVVRHVSFQLDRGQILGIVGESGSGKSTLIWALTRLLPDAASLNSGEVWFDGRDLLGLPPAEMRRLRGSRISYVSQDPMTSLAPSLTIGQQMTDILYREPLSARKKQARVLDALEWVRLPNPRERLSMFPHELSGGQRQRVSIAMALMLKPDLVLADEPTTALDPTLEVEILDLLRRLQRETGAAVVFVTHHLGVVASLCDQVLVMKDGKIREAGAVSKVFAQPTDDYTKRLLLCDPAQITEPQRRLPTMADPTPAVASTRTPHVEAKVLSVDGLTLAYPSRSFQALGRQSPKPAVSDVGFTIARGETLALIGESGSGKTTIARSLLGLMRPQSGQITLCGQPMAEATPSQWRAAREKVAMMFQDPIGSLSPRMCLSEQVVEPLIVHGREREATRARALELLSQVGLDARFADRYPHEMSGGQARRACIARALALSPELLIADEPTAGLDVSIQGEVINLLNDLQERLGLSILLITHNMAVVRHAADRMLVLLKGRIVEEGPTARIFAAPQQPYTAALIAAAHHDLPKSENLSDVDV